MTLPRSSRLLRNPATTSTPCACCRWHAQPISRCTPLLGCLGVPDLRNGGHPVRVVGFGSDLLDVDDLGGQLGPGAGSHGRLLTVGSPRPRVQGWWDRVVGRRAGAGTRPRAAPGRPPPHRVGGDQGGHRSSVWAACRKARSALACRRPSRAGRPAGVAAQDAAVGMRRRARAQRGRAGFGGRCY
jgi:hypothetical protein